MSQMDKFMRKEIIDYARARRGLPIDHFDFAPISKRRMGRLKRFLLSNNTIGLAIVALGFLAAMLVAAQ